MARRAGAPAGGAGGAGAAGAAGARRQAVLAHHRLPALDQGRPARPTGAGHLRRALHGSRRGSSFVVMLVAVWRGWVDHY